jgi:hypothetical protein
MPSHWTPTPEDEMRPKGPWRALEEAVAILAPFELNLIKRGSLDGSELKSEDPEMMARASVHNLAEDLNSAVYRARHAPRVKEMVAGLTKSRDLLRNASSAIASLDDWSRFHLSADLYASSLEPRWLPPYGSTEPGEFVELAVNLANQLDEVITNLRAWYGGNQAIDQGGRHSHEERFLGTAKTRFVRDAFEIFDTYHPRTASSPDGSPFHTFVHKVYEFATGDHDEDKAAISYKLRELITPLHQHKEANRGYWAIEEKLSSVAPNSPEYRELTRQQNEFRRKMSKLEAIFVPNLGRVKKISQPPSIKLG